MITATLSPPPLPSPQSALLRGFLLFAVAFGALTGVALALLTGAALLLAQFIAG